MSDTGQRPLQADTGAGMRLFSNALVGGALLAGLAGLAPTLLRTGVPGMGWGQILVLSLAVYGLLTRLCLHWVRRIVWVPFLTAHVVLLGSGAVLLAAVLWGPYASRLIAATIVLLALPLLALVNLLFARFVIGKGLPIPVYVVAWLSAAGVVLAAGSLIATKLVVYAPVYWEGFVPDRLLGWYPAPNVTNLLLHVGRTPYRISTDARGHRNSVPYSSDGVLDWAVQGDSFVFGYGVSDGETLTARLNELCTTQRFYNVAVSGYDVNQYYFQYARLAKQFRISNRLIVFNSGNDFSCTAMKTAYHILRPYLEVRDGVVHECLDNVNAVCAQAYDTQMIPKYAAYNAKVHERNPALNWAARWPNWILRVPLCVWFAKEVMPLYIVQKELDVGTRLEVWNPSWMYLRESRWPTPFKQFRADFSVILGAVKAQNPACTLVLVPIRALVLDAEFDKVKARLLASGYREDEIDRYAINRFIERLCRERGIGFIDLTPVYTQHADPITLFLAGDNHPSPAGTRVCAQTICDAMSRGSRH